VYMGIWGIIEVTRFHTVSALLSPVSVRLCSAAV
jgi:hypothetical protein